jgi:D-glycero-D-manno-heptose 1,7-bisphosphate phosphatase
MYNQTMKPAIFLDRDGVVIENRSDYVRRWEDVEIFPAAVDALAKLSSSPYQIIFITNQSAIGRGLISLEDAQMINQMLVDKLLTFGCRIDGIFMCPHAPDENCTCRKPLPGLLIQAAESLNIDLSKSIMIGDAWSDLQAGHAAGISQVALVLTGRGRQQLTLPRPSELGIAPVYQDLSEAFKDLVAWP